MTKSLDAAGMRETELNAAADEILRHAIFKGDHELGARLYEQHREIAGLDIYTAVAAGDLGEVERRLAADPAAATRAGGPQGWPPLLYLAYMRLPGSAAQSVEIARALLERGADPFDTQTFYNTSIVHDDTHWLDVLWAEAERRGTVDRWSEPPTRRSAASSARMRSISC